MTQKQTIDITSTNSNELSIQVSLSGLSFCIYNKSGNTVIALEHHTFSGIQRPEVITGELDRHFQENELLRQSFEKIALIHENDLSAFVPQSLFDEKALPDYLKFNVKILENDFVTYDTLKDHELINVYIPYANVNNFIFERFGAFEYRHFSTILVNTILNQTPGEEETRMFVNVRKAHFEIVAVKDGKLALYNTFHHNTKEDFLYYMLFVAEQLQLDPEVFPLYLFGEIEEGDPFYDMVYTYVRHVFFGENYCRFLFREGVEKPALHKDLILLNSF